MKHRIGNIGTLDLRHATQASIGEGVEAQNIGALIFSRKSADLIAKVHAANIGATIECNGELQTTSGQTELTRGQLAQVSEPVTMLVMGQLIVHSDIDAEVLKRSVERLHVFGQVYCPSDLMVAVQSRVGELNGQLVSYPGDHQLLTRSLIMDSARLSAMPDNSKIAVLGKLSIASDVSAELVERKLASLWVQRHLSLFEHHAEVLLGRLHAESRAQIEVIPKAYDIIDTPVRFDNSDVQGWQDEHLYFLSRVEFAPDVDPDLLAERLTAFQAKSLVLCPEALKSVLQARCSKHQTRIITYSGTLITNEGQATIRASQLERAEAVTVVNQGVVQWEAMDESLVAQKLDKLLNDGVVSAPAPLLGILESKAVINNGVISELDLSGDAASGDSDAAGYDIANVAMLRL